MWLLKTSRNALAIIFAGSLGLLSACTVEPLNKSNANSAVSGGAVDSSTAAVLASIQVAEVNSRVAQQTRNALLFALNGGNPVPSGNLKVNLGVVSRAQNLSVLTSVQAPTSAQVQLTATYSMVNTQTGETIASGTRRSIAAYDLTSQNFANQRALRNAENRAAKSVAQQIRLALAQKVAGR